MTITEPTGRRTGIITTAWRATRGHWFHVSLFSTLVNILMLTGSLYMLQVYDRVLASRSVPTLVVLSVITIAAFVLQGVLDAMRLKLLGRIGATVDGHLAPVAAQAAIQFPLKGAKPHEALQPLRDVDSVRTFLSSIGPTALIDMPFMPLFLAACFLLHPWLGWLGVAGAVIIVALTLWTERASKAPGMALMQSMVARGALVEAGRRNAEVIAGLGMARSFQQQFEASHGRQVGDGLALTDSTSTLSSTAKTIRFVLQSAVLGLGAFLVIRGEMTAGAMIAASILTSRALAPIEIAVAHWKAFVAARQGWQRLQRSLPLVRAGGKSVALPAPATSLALQDVTVVAPGTQRAILQGISFQLAAGQAVGLIGPSGSGKSTLARTLVGAWPATRGAIRLDGALLSQWDVTELGRSLGYLPQDIELFDGTIAQNIARFDPSASTEAILSAARQAGAHELIVSFPDGYETRVGEGGVQLSGGQRQRIALARALYGDPFLVVLDEPNANLDTAGDEALTQAILSVRRRGGIAVVITHRPSGLAGVDVVGALAEGRLAAFGPREQVLQKILRGGGLPAVTRPGPAGAFKSAQANQTTGGP
jgi:ATP-binding cassette, subfamily C, bacterial PrsD